MCYNYFMVCIGNDWDELLRDEFKKDQGDLSTTSEKLKSDAADKMANQYSDASAHAKNSFDKAVNDYAEFLRTYAMIEGWYALKMQQGIHDIAAAQEGYMDEFNANVNDNSEEAKKRRELLAGVDDKKMLEWRKKKEAMDAKVRRKEEELKKSHEKRTK